MKAYGVTGMPLAGKTTVADLIKKKGFQMIDMGDAVRKEMDKREVRVEKTGEWVRNQREENGMDAIAEITLSYIENTEELVITGMRSLEEKERFEEELDIELEMIAVWASPQTREKRMNERRREEDVKGDKFSERDDREISHGIPELMALSDHMIINEDISMRELEEEVDEIVG